MAPCAIDGAEAEYPVRFAFPWNVAHVLAIGCAHELSMHMPTQSHASAREAVPRMAALS
jgi:Zn-dependent M28 family amino/carboxypeptidase